MPRIDLMADFKRTLKTSGRSEKTIEAYLRTVKKLTVFLKKEFGIPLSIDTLHQIKGYMISNWATSLEKFALSTRALHMTGARSFLQFLYRMQYVDFDLSQALPPSPAPRWNPSNGDDDQLSTKRGYTQEEIRRMFDYYNHKNSFASVRNKTILAVLLGTGLRISELLSLQTSDICPDTKFVKVPRKGSHGVKQSVPIANSAVDVVQEYMKARIDYGIPGEESGALFVSSTGKPMSRIMVYHELAQMQRAVQCPTGVHTYRHTVLTEIAKNNDAVIARDVAGQHSVSVTNRYLHSTSEERYSAVETLNSFIESYKDSTR